MTVRAIERETRGPGVPRLLQHLAEMTDEAVYLWLNPDRGETCWFVWTGHPTGSGGAEWGRGTTAFEALQDAFRRLTDAIFEGRVVTAERPFVGPKHCDHRADKLGSDIGSDCLCDYGNCRNSAVVLTDVHGTHFHFCEEHADA